MSSNCHHNQEAINNFDLIDILALVTSSHSFPPGNSGPNPHTQGHKNKAFCLYLHFTVVLHWHGCCKCALFSMVPAILVGWTSERAPNSTLLQALRPEETYVQLPSGWQSSEPKGHSWWGNSPVASPPSPKGQGGRWCLFPKTPCPFLETEIAVGELQASSCCCFSFACQSVNSL